MLRKLFRFVCPALALAAGAACVLRPTATAAQLVKKHADWSHYVNEEGGPKLCFVVAAPKDMQPQLGNRRDPPYFYISAWPQAGVRAEVSIKMGYPVKKGAEATVKIDNQTFRLFAEADRAFVAEPTEELKLIEAMKQGTRMVVTATSERGTATTDGYSLAGISQGLQDMTTGCQ